MGNTVSVQVDRSEFYKLLQAENFNQKGVQQSDDAPKGAKQLKLGGAGQSPGQVLDALLSQAGAAIDPLAFFAGLAEAAGAQNGQATMANLLPFFAGKGDMQDATGIKNGLSQNPALLSSFLDAINSQKAAGSAKFNAPLEGILDSDLTKSGDTQKRVSSSVSHPWASFNDKEIDLTTMDIETAMMAVMSRRVQVLEEQMASQLRTVQDRNQKIAAFSTQLEELRVKRAEISDPNTSAAKNLDAQIDNIKGKVDTLNNQQQLDMIRLQQLGAKRDDAYGTITNTMKKIAEGRSTIVRNFA